MKMQLSGIYGIQFSQKLEREERVRGCNDSQSAKVECMCGLRRTSIDYIDMWLNKYMDRII